jgi:hypothetical protein
LARDDHDIAFRYSVGGGYRESDGWEPLGPVGYYDTFGPELAFGARLRKSTRDSIAIAKFTHSGSQIIDWTPEGSEAKSRNLYETFITFVRESIRSLESEGHEVELAGVFYHLGENDMSWIPFRKHAAERMAAFVTKSRDDLGLRELNWYVSQQEPTDDKAVNAVDVVADVEAVAADDPHLIHIKAFGLPGREKKLVISTEGIVALGELLADRYLVR